MGIVIEYANKTGSPRWVKPQNKSWDYTIFGGPASTQSPVQTIPLVFGKINGGQGGFNRWTINGKGFDENAAPTTLQKGRRYRLVFDNQTDDAHPIHLHRNSFELTNVEGKATSGILKDVVLVKGYKRLRWMSRRPWTDSRFSIATSNSIWTMGSSCCSTLSEDFGHESKARPRPPRRAASPLDNDRPELLFE